jgi:hypothetical protein
MKVYTFELVIHEGSDEFWDGKPSDKEVRECVAEALASMGFFTREDDIDTLTLTKYELKK